MKIEKKLAELNEDELSEVLGGVANPASGLTRENAEKIAKSLGDGQSQDSFTTMSGDQFMKWWKKSNKQASEIISNADGVGVYHDGTNEEASWRRD